MISLSSTFRVQHGLRDVYISVKKNLKTSLTQNSTTWAILKSIDGKLEMLLNVDSRLLKVTRFPMVNFRHYVTDIDKLLNPLNPSRASVLRLIVLYPFIYCLLLVNLLTASFKTDQDISDRA